MTTVTSAIWAFEEDILTRSWLDWLEAHLSMLKPLHRFEGPLSILPDRLCFPGMDKRTGNDTYSDIYKYQIEELYLGFDESFNAMETRGLGLTWVPLRLTLTQNEKKENSMLCLIINWVGQTTKNISNS